ncbi:hypothetical protein SERLA73DRAFT_24110, partial [Serpula lacrymans var. lacrymans S7.3]
FNEIDTKTTISDFVIDKPSPYAINKVESGDYIELWYFTVEGCRDAFAHQHTIANTLSMITNDNNQVALKPAASYCASKNAKHDEDLTLNQIFIARTCLINEMDKAGWKRDFTRMLSHFYLQLDMHPKRRFSHSEQILVTYHAQAHHK